MDVLPRITGQIIELFRQMSPLQRVMTAAVLATVLFAFGYLLIWNPPGEYQPIATGKAFATDDLANAEKAFRAAGLTQFRRDGQRLLAPAHELQKYNAALAELSDQPDDLGTQMLKQYETLGPFSTDKQRQQMKEALLLQELRQTIKAVPDVEDARVAIASSERRLGWNEKPRTTANVSIKLRRNREMSPALVNSLRQVVANMVPDLKPSDVTVFDISRGQAYSGDTAREPQELRYQKRAREYARQYERQIEKALAHIPNVGVNVNIDPETLKSETKRRFAVRSAKESRMAADQPESDDESSSHLTGFRGSNDESMESSREESFIAALPQSIQVSVSIPRDYLRNLVAHRAANNEQSAERLNPELIEDEVLAKVEQIVSRLIPADAANDSISVTFIDPVTNNPDHLSKYFTNEKLTDFARQWGAAIAVVMVSLMLIAIFWRSTPDAVPTTEPETIVFPEIAIEPSLQQPSPVVLAQSIELPSDRAAILREEIRTLVKADPAATASILNQWLTEAGSGKGQIASLYDAAARKAAIFLLCLEQDAAAEVLGKLSREQVEVITLAIANTTTVAREEQESVLNDFKDSFAARPLMQPGGPATARELLERSLDRNEVEPVTQQLDEQIRSGPFAFLKNHHPDDIRLLLETEHPQTVALIAAQLPPELSARVLAGFAVETQTDVLARIARLGPTDGELLDEIATLLQDRIGRAPIRNGGVERAAEVLRESNRSTSRSVLQSLNQNDAKLAENLRESLFAFNDLRLLDQSTLKLVLEKTDHCQWAIALKGASESLRQQIFASMPASMVQALQEEIRASGPIRLSEITNVQRKITEMVMSLEADDGIELPRQSWPRKHSGAA